MPKNTIGSVSICAYRILLLQSLWNQRHFCTLIAMLAPLLLSRGPGWWQEARTVVANQINTKQNQSNARAPFWVSIWTTIQFIMSSSGTKLNWKTKRFQLQIRSLQFKLKDSVYESPCSKYHICQSTLFCQSTSFTLSAIYLIFPFSLRLCFGGKKSAFLLRKSFPSLHFRQISFSSVPIPLWVFYSGTVISALFLNSFVVNGSRSSTEGPKIKARTSSA